MMFDSTTLFGRVTERKIHREWDGLTVENKYGAVCGWGVWYRVHGAASVAHRWSVQNVCSKDFRPKNACRILTGHEQCDENAEVRTVVGGEVLGSVTRAFRLDDCAGLCLSLWARKTLTATIRTGVEVCGRAAAARRCSSRSSRHRRQRRRPCAPRARGTLTDRDTRCRCPRASRTSAWRSRSSRPCRLHRRRRRRWTRPRRDAPSWPVRRCRRNT